MIAVSLIVALGLVSVMVRPYWKLMSSSQRQTGFYCATCGAYHDDLPTDVGYKYPVPYLTLPTEERSVRARITADTCVIDNEEFFVRGCLYIPIRDRQESLCWGVWVSLNEQNFCRYEEIGNQDVSETEPAYFGWMCSSLPLYPNTLLMKTHVHLNKPGLRPTIELEPTDHPLAVDQREGISIEKWHEIINAVTLSE